MEKNHPPDGYAPGYDEASVYGDPNEASFGITKFTFDRLLKLENPSSCISLYAFFCYTARWQKTDQAKCTVSYAAKALGWSERTVHRTKAELVNIGLIQNVKSLDRETGLINGWYIKVRHTVRLCIHPDTDGRVDHPAKKPQCGYVAPKCLGTNNINASELIKPLIPIEESIELPFQSEEFKNSWGEWISYKKQRKQKFVAASQVKILKKLKLIGEARAIAAIEASIEGCWQGIYEPKSNFKNQQQTKITEIKKPGRDW